MDDSTFLAIVTVTYNSATVVDDFLESLTVNMLMPRVRLYLVDNASADNTLKRVDKYKGLIDMVVVENAKNLGAAAGNNQGISAALADGADWILLVNNDTVLPEGTLTGLIDTAKKQGLHILSPTILGNEPQESIWYAGGTISPYQGMKVRHQDFGASVLAAPRGLRKTQYASTCCLLLHRDVLCRIGGLDEEYFVYFEDVDFAVRAKSAGFTYWVTGDYRIVHKASSLTGGYLSSFSVRWISRNWVVVARKQCSSFQRVAGLAYMQLWMLARLLTRRDTLARYRLRQRSFVEGCKLPIAHLPKA